MAVTRGSNYERVLGEDLWFEDALHAHKGDVLAVPAFLVVGEGLRFHGGEADLGMDLEDPIDAGGAGIDLEDLLAERVGLARDTPAEKLFRQSIGFGI